MRSSLEDWAIIEKRFIEEDIEWLEAGVKTISPSGDDITARQLERLRTRLDHAKAVTRDIKDAHRT